ncbi:unnamed protein product [Somion occarium]|uniref:SWIM-type domain-containing protein n=1 Tax=Somion occarium TaxID=3059160 RepID=A0ABP1CIJ5_9APHY
MYDAHIPSDPKPCNGCIWHRFSFPCRHSRHVWQLLRQYTATYMPVVIFGYFSATALPNSATTPAPSCPIVKESLVRASRLIASRWYKAETSE